MTWAPTGRDQVPAAGVDDDRGDQQPGRGAGDRAVADLLEQEGRGAASIRDPGSDVGDGDGGEEQRHADPVVQAALDVQPLADSLGNARLGDDGLSQRRVGGRQHDRQDQGLGDGQLGEDHSRDGGPDGNSQRQADAEQAHRQADLDCAARAGRCARRHRREPAPGSPRPACGRPSSSPRDRSRQAPSARQQSDADEQHRRGDRGSGKTTRDCRNTEEGERPDCK